MRFWRLECPDYDSDYTSSYINGSLEHPFGLPGVDCGVCHQVWGGSRILPVELPASLRGLKHLNERWPISLEQHRALQLQVAVELNRSGIVVRELRPGDDFQPGYLDVPSIPRSDFLWACLGSVVVSQRVRNLFESMGIGDVAYVPVRIRKIGNREAHLSVPVPSSGEPEDIIHEVPPLIGSDSLNPYFEMIIQSASEYAPQVEPIATCSGCGRETFRDDERRLIMSETMWRGADLFFLRSTLYIVVTDRIQRALSDLGATNVQFAPFEAA